MPSKVLSIQNPILFFFSFPVSESCKSTYTHQRRRRGRVGEGRWLSRSGRSGCRRLAPPGWGAGDPGFSGGGLPGPLGLGSSPLAKGSGGSQGCAAPTPNRETPWGLGSGGRLRVSLCPRLLILGAGCKLVGSGSRKPRHKELERELLPPRF